MTVTAQTERKSRAFRGQRHRSGIAPEAQARLFRPFVRADSSTSRKFGGTALGLAICKRLAESMNGSIGVESTPGVGSTFWVTFRFCRQAAIKSQPQTMDEFVDTSVLIVDDNETSRLFLHQQITAWRMRDGCASSGKEALALLHRSATEKPPYRVAIIDLQMPDMDGLALVRKINADPLLSATRLILLTPFGKPIPTESRSLGCCGLLGQTGTPIGTFRLSVQVLTGPEDASQSRPPGPS